MTERELQLAAIMAADAKTLRVRAQRDSANIGSGTVYSADGVAYATAKPGRVLSAEEKEMRRGAWSLERRIELARANLGREPTREELEKMEHRRLKRQRNREREAAKAAGNPLPDLRKARPSKATPPTPTPAPTRERRKPGRIYTSKYLTDADRVEARRIRDTRARRLAGVPARHFVKRKGNARGT